MSQLFSKLVVLLLCIKAITCVGPRTVTFVNNCDDTYYYQITPGASQTAACNSDADCIAGSFCLLPDTHLCYWKVPKPDNGHFELPPKGVSTITLPYVDNGSGTHWSGNFGFCKGDSCSDTPANCHSKGCVVVNGPVNLAEITMLKTDTDYYDVSNIGGINVGMAFGPLNVPESRKQNDKEPYKCGTPGAPVGAHGIGDCSWAPSAPLIQNIYVAGGDANKCTTNADCKGGQVCGLSMKPGRTPMFELTCGVFYGYWTANSICAKDPEGSLTANPFACSTTIQNGPIAARLGGLYQCDFTSGSGYTMGATTSSCGCADWQNMGYAVPAATDLCANTNPIWMDLVLPTLTWLKKACPAAYTFPYDDKSATFVCSNAPVGQFNSVNYHVTICPSNSSVVPITGQVSGGATTGLPSTIGGITITGAVTGTGISSGISSGPSSGRISVLTGISITSLPVGISSAAISVVPSFLVLVMLLCLSLLHQ